MKLLVDEDTASATLLARLRAAGHELVHVPAGTPDEVVFREAQRLALPMLTANVGRTGRRDPVGFYRLAVEHISHYGVIGILCPAPRRWLADTMIVAALARLAIPEHAQAGIALLPNGVTRRNDFLPP